MLSFDLFEGGDTNLFRDLLHPLLPAAEKFDQDLNTGKSPDRNTPGRAGGYAVRI